MLYFCLKSNIVGGPIYENASSQSRMLSTRFMTLSGWDLTNFLSHAPSFFVGIIPATRPFHSPRRNDAAPYSEESHFCATRQNSVRNIPSCSVLVSGCSICVFMFVRIFDRSRVSSILSVFRNWASDKYPRLRTKQVSTRLFVLTTRCHCLDTVAKLRRFSTFVHIW